ncbi:uncharacterized protein LOC111337453 [Stylophora pistillata]|uniref:uncharacterized protein LOC111337453 n=1 Tax=Stylophora pistillata TaxID=50429 RepID=UPI000C04BBDE|nr:uncharacterized protein LOC111337453 [Stylophora pistillata]
MGQQSSRLLELSSTKFTLTGFRHHSDCTMTRRDFVLALWFFMLVFTTEANSSCNPEQVIWTNAVGKAGFKCLDCPSCPPGSEPSVPCGTKIENWTSISCVPCQLGKTYSDKNDTAHCKPCTVCSAGRAILKNCTLESNSQCSECEEGLYPEPLSFSCRRCSECCGDEKDLVASECRRYKYKCQVRSTPCSKKIRSTILALGLKKTTSPPTIALKDQPTNLVVMKETRSSIIPTRVVDKDVPTDMAKVVIISLAAVVVTVVSLRTFVQIVIRKCGTPRDTQKPSGELESTNIENSSPQIEVRCEVNRPASQSNGSISLPLNPVFTPASGSTTPLHNCGESSGKSGPPLPKSQDSAWSQPNRSSPPADVEYTVDPDDVNLEELEENHQDVFDWMCNELDAMQRDRWDFERLAFRYNIPSTISKSLKNAFQRNGSPSYALMAHLRAKYPDLPLHHIIKNLKIIGRNDIASRLRPYLKNNVVSSLA